MIPEMETPISRAATNTVVVGDARHIPLPDESVNLVCTSPPYWSQRNYGVKPSVGVAIRGASMCGCPCHVKAVLRNHQIRSGGSMWGKGHLVIP